jgi:SPP1 family predicted phage head-tail adaptor
MMNAGAMREQVQLQSRTTTQDSAGEPLGTWNVFSTVRAEVVRTPGRSMWDQGSSERNGRVPTMFRLRWQDGVLPEMRLICRSRVYRIMSAIDTSGRREELVVTCEELVGETP